MPDRPTFPLVFGRGLDRATGALAESPGTMEVLENVYLLNGRVEVRGGVETRSVIEGAAYTAAIAADLTTLQGVRVVGFGEPGEASHLLRIYTNTGSGTAPVLVDDWVDPCEGLEPARVIAAQSGSRTFLAHEERSVSRRAGTVVYNSADNSVTPLVAEWARGGVPENSDALRFRYVVPWLDYMVGVGFGTAAEDRPHMLRISGPGEPDVFQEDAWLLAGQGGEPVQAAQPLERVLMVPKVNSTFFVTGDNPDNFGGPWHVDRRYGIAASRLLCTEGGEGFGWSLDGPRVWRGMAASEDFGWPLGRPWPTAKMIAADGRMEDAFAEYVPVRRLVVFVFGDWVYVYDLQRKEWNFWELGVTVHCGGVLYTQSGYQGASRGWPDYGDAAVVDADSRLVSWANVSAEGDETVELWLREAGGAWPGAATATRSVALSPALQLDALTEDTDYEVALRYNRGGLFSASYTGAPDTWPSVSRGTFNVPPAPPPPPEMDPPTALDGDLERECVPTEPPFLLPCAPTVTYSLTWMVGMADALVVVETTAPGEVGWSELVELPIGTEAYEVEYQNGPGGGDPDPTGRSFRVRHRKVVGGTPYESDPTTTLELP